MGPYGAVACWVLHPINLKPIPTLQTKTRLVNTRLYGSRDSGIQFTRQVPERRSRSTFISLTGEILYRLLLQPDLWKQITYVIYFK